MAREKGHAKELGGIYLAVDIKIRQNIKADVNCLIIKQARHMKTGWL